MNILFEADLSRYVAHRPSVLYWVLQPCAGVGGIGMGLGLVVSLKIFTLLTRDVDEWAEVKKNNLGMSIILSAVILGTSLVIMMSVH